MSSAPIFFLCPAPHWARALEATPCCARPCLASGSSSVKWALWSLHYRLPWPLDEPSHIQVAWHTPGAQKSVASLFHRSHQQQQLHGSQVFSSTFYYKNFQINRKIERILQLYQHLDSAISILLFLFYPHICWVLWWISVHFIFLWWISKSWNIFIKIFEDSVYIKQYF